MFKQPESERNFKTSFCKSAAGKVCGCECSFNYCHVEYLKVYIYNSLICITYLFGSLL